VAQLLQTDTDSKVLAMLA